MCRIRPGEEADVAWVVEQLRAFSRFFGSKRPLFSTESVAQDRVLWMIREHLFLMAVDFDGKPLGFISGIVTPHVFNPDIRVLAEAFWWVDEAARGGRAGLMLLGAFLEWGKEHADWVTFSLETSSPVNDRALTNRGFKLHERSYLLEVA